MLPSFRFALPVLRWHRDTVIIVIFITGIDPGLEKKTREKYGELTISLMGTYLSLSLSTVHTNDSCYPQTKHTSEQKEIDILILTDKSEVWP